MQGGGLGGAEGTKELGQRNYHTIEWQWPESICEQRKMEIHVIDNSNRHIVSLDNRPVNSCETSKISRGNWGPSEAKSKREQG